MWSSIRRRDVFPVQPAWMLAVLAGRSDHLISPGKFRRLVGQRLAIEPLEEASTPVAVVAIEVTAGEQVVLTRGPAVDAVLTSVAVPGLFPRSASATAT